jgi:hypothetical protein
VAQELDHRDVALAVGLETRHVVGHPVGEAQGPLLREDPHRAGGDDLGAGVEQPERLVARGHADGIEAGVAEGAEERELAAAATAI